MTYAIIGIAMGPLASYIPGLVPARYRFTGVALSYNLGGIIGGALPPVVSPALLASFGSWAIGLMMGCLALFSLGCVVLLDDND